MHRDLFISYIKQFKSRKHWFSYSKVPKTKAVSYFRFSVFWTLSFLLLLDAFCLEFPSGIVTTLKSRKMEPSFVYAGNKGSLLFLATLITIVPSFTSSFQNYGHNPWQTYGALTNSFYFHYGCCSKTRHRSLNFSYTN